MTKAPELQFPSEELKEITLHLVGGYVLRFPLREMDIESLRKWVQKGEATLTVEFEDCLSCVAPRSVIYFDISKDSYEAEEDSYLPQTTFSASA